MCGTCGCGSTATIDGHDHAHHHDHDHDNDHRTLQVELNLLAKNDGYAAENRRFFSDKSILAVNVMSSPGSGKTSLLIKTIERLLPDQPVCVIEGDQQTSADADRIRATGAPAVQINTGKGCHLDAHMVGHAAHQLSPTQGSVLFIENVGNLVCPAGFDLGEAAKVVILSVTEGEDKPLKYPDMFAACDLMLVNKADLLPYVEFRVDHAISNARRVNPNIDAITISATTGSGMEKWLSWIGARQSAQLKTAAE